MGNRGLSQDIDADTLRSWLDAGRQVTVLDVRPEGQRAEWAIPGSIHADLYDALKAGDTGAVRRLSLPEGIPVVTVCALGKTSKKAADILAQSGIQAYSLSGGMQAGASPGMWRKSRPACTIWSLSRSAEQARDAFPTSWYPEARLR